MKDRSGGCMCGAVTFTAKDVPDSFGACHCEMCRRWTGSALLGVTVPTENITWSNDAQIEKIQSSGWAERAWCKKCGTGLYFRVTMEGNFFGGTELPIGLFDDASGMKMDNEIYIDHKPDSFAYAGSGRQVLTRQQCVEKFSVLDDDDANAQPQGISERGHHDKD